MSTRHVSWLFVLTGTLVLLSGCSSEADQGAKAYTVTTSAGIGGSISPHQATVADGKTTSFAVLPETGYRIGIIRGCGGEMTDPTTYTTGPVTDDCDITVSFALLDGGTSQSYTITTMVGAGGSISPDKATVDEGSTSSFTVSTELGYRIENIIGCGGEMTGAGTYTTGPVTADCGITVSFAPVDGGTPQTYTITTFAGVGGSITPDKATVDEGSTSSFAISPELGYRIENITGCGGELTDTNTYATGPVTADCDVTVSFTPILPSYTITAIAGAGGSITPDKATVDEGSTGSFTVSPELGYRIENITGCGGELTDTNTYTTGPVTADCDVTVSFTPILPSYTITAVAEAGGSITPDKATLDEGSTGSFTVSPELGYRIENITGCGGDMTDATTYTTGPVNADCNIEVSFALKMYALGGTVTGLTPGSAVVLQNNGADDLTVEEDGPFTFTVVHGTDYAVEVKSQPLGQQCLVQGGDGTAMGDVTGIDVQCYAKAELGATALSEAVVLSWDGDSAASHDLYYSTDPRCDIAYINACPSGTLITNVTSPMTVSGLTNGQNYTFWLNAYHGSDRTVLSSSGARPDRLATNGEVLSIVTDIDGTAYLGGKFTRVGARTGGGVPLLKGTDGTRPFPLVNGAVSGFVSDNAGGWYIGGNFDRVGGIQRNYLAHVLADGNVSPWNPGPNAPVSSLAMNGNTVFAGGFFTSIGGVSHDYFAALDAETGSLTSWSPSADALVIAFAISGDTLYAGGSFTAINGQPRSHIAALDVNTGLLKDWDPGANDRVVEFALSDGVLYAAGAFTAIGTEPRNFLAAFDADSGQLSPWNPNPNYSVDSVAVSGNTVYVGGGFTIISDSPRDRIAALDAVTAEVTPWNPGAAGKVRALAVDGNTLYAAGQFAHIDREQRYNLAAFDISTGDITSWNPGANSQVTGLAVTGDTLFIAGGFSIVGGLDRKYLASVDPSGHLREWNPKANAWVDAVTLSSGTVYAGGRFTTLGDRSRNYIGAVDADTGAITTWNPDANGPVLALAADGETIYAGGRFSSIGGYPKFNLVGLNAADGQASTYVPTPNSSVYAIAVSGSTVYVAGDFTTMANQPRNRIAAFDASGTLMDWDPNANGRVRALAVRGDTVYAGGDFTSMCGASRYHIAALMPDPEYCYNWFPHPPNSVYSLAVKDNTVYAGTWSSLEAYDGTTGAELPHPEITGAAEALSISGTRLYLGGTFHLVDGEVTSGFATVSP